MLVFWYFETEKETTDIWVIAVFGVTLLVSEQCSKNFDISIAVSIG